MRMPSFAKTLPKLGRNYFTQNFRQGARAGSWGDFDQPTTPPGGKQAWLPTHYVVTECLAKMYYTVKKGYRFLLPSRDVTNQTLSGRE